MNGNDDLQPARFSTWEARRICLVKPTALGDVVQTLPLLAVLRDRFPKAHLAWVVHQSYTSLLEPIQILDEVIPFDRQGLAKTGWSGLRAFARDLRRRQFDLVIDVQGLLRSALISWATHAPRRVGLRSAREGASWFYTHMVDDRPAQANAVDRYWSVARELGCEAWPKRFPLDLTAAEQQSAREWLAGLPRPVVAINPGARWVTKRWPAERFGQMANSVPAAGVVVLGGPGEESMAEAACQAISKPVRNLCGRLSLRKLAAVLGESAMLLTGDTGPAHLAAAVGTPTVSVFLCTDPVRSGAFGTNHRVCQTTVPCRAQYLKTCKSMVCLDQLTVPVVQPTVAAAWRELLPIVHQEVA